MKMKSFSRHFKDSLLTSLTSFSGLFKICLILDPNYSFYRFKIIYIIKKCIKKKNFDFFKNFSCKTTLILSSCVILNCIFNYLHLLNTACGITMDLLMSMEPKEHWEATFEYRCSSNQLHNDSFEKIFEEEWTILNSALEPCLVILIFNY